MVQHDKRMHLPRIPNQVFVLRIWISFVDDSRIAAVQMSLCCKNPTTEIISMFNLINSLRLHNYFAMTPNLAQRILNSFLTSIRELCQISKDELLDTVDKKYTLLSIPFSYLYRFFYEIMQKKWKKWIFILIFWKLH